MHVAGACRLRILLGHVGDEGVGREQEARDRGCVLERSADDLGGVHHTGGHEVLVGVGGGVVAVCAAFGANRLDDHGAVLAGVGRDLTDRRLDGTAHDHGADLFVACELEAFDAVDAGEQRYATAGDDAIKAQFPTDAIFHAIRLSPYLEATAAAHPKLAPALIDLSRVTGNTHAALVHGDVSPKNILAGPDGPVFLDAECAWYGDPAFDLAFCLNHLLLKCLARPEAAPGYLECFDALAGAYGETVSDGTNGPLPDVEAQAARLLPGLFLARIDGKSPVEYITNEADREKVRRTAGKLLSDPVSRLEDVRRAWTEELERSPSA